MREISKSEVIPTQESTLIQSFVVNIQNLLELGFIELDQTLVRRLSHHWCQHKLPKEH